MRSVSHGLGSECHGPDRANKFRKMMGRVAAHSSEHMTGRTGSLPIIARFHGPGRAAAYPPKIDELGRAVAHDMKK